MTSPNVMLWQLLTKPTQQRIIKWQSKHYPNRPLNVPEEEIKLDPVDVAKEMVKKPTCENLFKETR